MSHFTVLVIGPDYEKQLAPYHEFECTGHDDEYVVNVDITKEILDSIKNGASVEHALEDYGLWENRIQEGAPLDLKDAHKYGYAVMNPDDSVNKVVRRTNPNKKWDWYSVGGRWSGFFKLKPGATGVLGEPSIFDTTPQTEGADQALKNAIDFDGMREEAASEALTRYREVRALLDSHPVPRTWPDIRDNTPDIKQARDDYHAQPAVKAMMSNKDFYWLNVEDFLCTEEEYFIRARNEAISTYAVVKDGVWYGKGEMGWFGVSLDEVNEAVWLQKMNELIDSCPDDTLFTLVDCHI